MRVIIYNHTNIYMHLNVVLLRCILVKLLAQCVPDQKKCDCIVSLVERSRIDKIQINKSMYSIHARGH